jgi:hypothetical protein
VLFAKYFSRKEVFMPQNHPADMQNANKGVVGQNQTHAHNQGNRGAQLNPTPNAANQYKSGNGGQKQ